ncbi:Sulfur carrier protein adenylyltransferase ThiF [hydrothermal vent metagenome]|uniref:Sulfur carrier protein adenylyltransferase ThiF n=1 Tax=hydrothermal vent metagenome TaxID=652676 RepID=A0A3B1E0F2_9ZZZZ
MTEFNNYFNRQIQLWGEQTQQSLQSKKIAIIGCGGLGCSLGMALGSSGIGHIDLVDFDEVSIHNIHRQIGFKIGDEGKAKCEVLKELIISRCLYIDINTFNMNFEEFTHINNTYDLLLDATDNLLVRAMIDNFAKKKSFPWIYGSVEAFHGQVCFFDNASFESIFNISDHKPDGIAAPIVMNIASFQANLALRYLVKLEVKKDFLYYCFFNDEGIFETKKLGLPT